MTMTMTMTIPGNWPQPVDEMVTNEDLSFLQLNTKLGESSLQVPSTTSSTSSGSSREELFFDIPSPSTARDNLNNEEHSPSYLIFEPVVESVSADEPTDWKRYEPPMELLETQEETSEDVRSLLAASIERIKARHSREEERRIAAAREERPLGRKGKASVKPKRERLTMMSGALDPLRDESQSCINRASATSLTSNDSGYLSMSPPENHSKTQSKSSRKSYGLTGLGALFRRKEKGISSLVEHTHSITVSQIASPVVVPAVVEEPVPEPPTTECVSCLDDFDTPEMIKLTCHSYCSGCFQRLINNALESETHWPPKCCLNTIPVTTITPRLDAATNARYAQRNQEWSIPASDRIYCSSPTCSSWIPPANVTARGAKCPSLTCRKKTCTTCHGPWHTTGDCPQDPALQATIALAETEGWKRCYSCQALVEHNKGCRHMTCRCKAQFCYICGERWRTCACTDAQLATVQAQALQRRQATVARTARQQREDEERAAQEAAEEEEMRMAIQQVADFERAEAEREAAEAEARRLREEEERRVAEEARIAAVDLRFRAANSEMELLHDVQRVLMAERYESEIEAIIQSRHDDLNALAIRHPKEIKALAAESELRIVKKEQEFHKDYEQRHAEEQQIEANFMVELHTYWNGHPDGEYQIRDARDELRRGQDKEYQFWNSYRRNQLMAFKEGEKRKMEMMRVKHASEIKAVEGRSKIDEVEWKRRNKAEDMWVTEVQRERGVMLREMEQSEYARSG